jgi:L-threonylcarbamoyladenylate synthase
MDYLDQNMVEQFLGINYRLYISMSNVIKQAVKLIESGKIISFPTETVYAIAASAENDTAIGGIYTLKGRDFTKPFAIFVKDVASIKNVAKLDERTIKIANKFCPGPITFVLPKSPEYGRNSRLNTIAVRIPDNEIAMEILQNINCPIVATSANPSGKKEATNAKQVKDYFPNLDLIIDGGECAIGTASTIIDLCGRDIKILRQGSITLADIEAAL